MDIVVVSLFDGISGARVALGKTGLNALRYYSSEIDKYALAVAQARHPQDNAYRLGDVRDIDGAALRKEIEEEFPNTPILLMGGFPCQAFSAAGRKLYFKDERGKLFFDLLRIKEQLSPDYFLFENVKMKAEIKDILSEYLGCQPTEINSALVSAQNRVRLYWTNWDVPQPEDKHIYLADIIEEGVVDREKSYAIDANYYKGGNLKQYFEKSRRQLVFTPAAMRGRYLDGKDKPATQVIEIKEDGKTNALTTVMKDNIVVYDINYRHLTPIECERLQTYADDWTLVAHPTKKNAMMSKTQRYKMLGNSFTVDVIAHILSYIKEA